MNVIFPSEKVLAAFSLAALSTAAHAGSVSPEPALPSGSPYVISIPAETLALNGEGAGKAEMTAEPAARPARVKLPVWTGSKLHQYFGLGTLALVGLTALTAPENEHGQAASTSGIHPSFGRATAAMAAAAVTTGLIYHWKDVHAEDGWTDPDNLHALLAGAGAFAMLYAVSRAPASGHSGAGVLGGIAMGVAVKLTW